MRADLLEAHDEGRRASAATYRHLASCGECRAFRAGLRDTRKAAAILMPVPLVIVAFGLLTGKAAAATAKGAMVKTAATAAAGVAITAGAVGVGVQVFQPGDPAPQAAKSRALPQGSLAKGGALPKGTAIVRKTVPLAGGGSTVVAALPAGPACRRPDRRPRRERELRARHGRRRQPQRARDRRAAAGRERGERAGDAAVQGARPARARSWPASPAARRRAARR